MQITGLDSPLGWFGLALFFTMFGGFIALGVGIVLGWLRPSATSDTLMGWGRRWADAAGLEAQGGVGGPVAREPKELLVIDATAACDLGRGLPTRPALPILDPATHGGSLLKPLLRVV